MTNAWFEETLYIRALQNFEGVGVQSNDNTISVHVFCVMYCTVPTLHIRPRHTWYVGRYNFLQLLVLTPRPSRDSLISIWSGQIQTKVFAPNYVETLDCMNHPFAVGALRQ